MQSQNNGSGENHTIFIRLVLGKNNSAHPSLCTYIRENLRFPTQNGILPILHRNHQPRLSVRMDVKILPAKKSGKIELTFQNYLFSQQLSY